MKQYRLPTIEPVFREFGGEHAKGKRKAARPFHPKKAIHVTLRARQSNLHSEAKAIEACWQKLSRENDVQVYQFSNNNNHLHFLLRARHRYGFKRFLRAFAGRVAQLVTKATKGRKLTDGFWALLPWTRIVEWGKGFLRAAAYVIQNQQEAAGLVPYRPRALRGQLTKTPR